MLGRRRTSTLTLATLLVVIAAGTAAFAQTVDDALRRDLVAQADAARGAGDHARAIEIANRAAQIRMTPSLALLLAQEHEQIGHIVDALDHARRCTSDATSDATLRNRERILTICRELVEVLSARVAHVTVRLPAGVEGAGATLRVGDRVLPPAAWGAAVPVDPGAVVIRVRTADGRTFERAVDVARGGSVEVVVAFPTMADSTAPTPVTVGPRVVVREAPPDAGRSVGAGPWVLGGVGAVAFVSAGVLWALHGSAMSDRDGACDVGGCDPSSVDADSRMRGLTLGTNVTIGVGSAALAGAVVWWLVGRSSSRETPAVRTSAWVTSGGAGIALGGTL